MDIYIYIYIWIYIWIYMDMLFIGTRRFAMRRHVPIHSRVPLPQHTATTCVRASGCRVPARTCCN